MNCLKTLSAKILPGVLFTALATQPALSMAEVLEDDSPRVAENPGDLLIYRLWGEQLSALDYGDEDSATTGIRQMLRGHIALKHDLFELHAEADMLAGQLFGDQPPEMPRRAQTDTRAERDLFDTGRLVDPREFYATWRSPAGQLSAGLQGSQWGLGLIANDGAAENEDLFNQHFGGDRVLRAAFATAPLRPLVDNSFTDDIYLAVGADMVWRDENADFLAGDRALQGMAAAFYRGQDASGGFYTVYRDQDDRNGDFLRVWVFDGFADYRFSPLADFSFRAAGELAFMTGESDRTWVQSDAAPTGIKALGLAGEFEARYQPLDLSLELKLGLATGDADSDDETLYRFRFDPNYRVGLILFDHYLPAVARQNVAGIFDPDQSGYPPRGTDGLLMDGGVENALYINPRLLYGDEDGFLAGLGFLWAKADQPIADLYRSFTQGGTLVGINGRNPASDDLGVELDAAAQYRFTMVEELMLELKGEYGIFFPGEAFADAEGNLRDAQNLVRMRVSLIW